MIVKYCDSKHNARHAKTIQIGTLEYYRKHANEFIKDPDEGIENRIVKPRPGLTTTGPDLGNNHQGPIIFGFNSASITPLTFPNTYIFCCSIVDHEAQIDPSTFGYNSFYVIKDYKEFAKQVGNTLLDLQKKKKSLSDVVTVHPFISEVKYLDDKTETYEDLHPRINNIDIDFLFRKNKYSKTKKKDFSVERELRFAWLLIDKNKNAVDVEKDPIQIQNSKLIRKCLEFR